MITVLRETHEAPASVQERLARAGGWNRFGEPNFRVVWGGSRLGWIGGRWTDRAADGNTLRERIELRLEPKYLPFDRWHVERWCPPEMYGTPREWYQRTLEIEDGRNVAALGPYPSRGEYELAFTLQGPRGEFVQLTPTVVEHCARLIEFARGSPRRNARAALYEREARAERAYDAWAFDLLDDTVPALYGVPFVTVPASFALQRPKGHRENTEERRP